MRARYERPKGGAGPVLAAVALAVVLGGLVYAFWGTIMERLSPGATPERESPVAERKVESDKEVAKPAPAPATKERTEPGAPGEGLKDAARPQPAASDQARERAEAKAREGEEALRALKFDLAAEIFKKAEREVPAGSVEAGRLRALGEKAEVFHRATKGLAFNPEADGNFVFVRPTSGAEMEVALLEHRGGIYYFAKKNGIKFPMNDENVAEIVPISQETRRERALREFRAAEQARTESSGVAFFLLAEQAYREKLGEQAVAYLDRAYEKDGKNLPASIRKYQAGKLLQDIIWCENTGRTMSATTTYRKLAKEYQNDLPDLVAEGREIIERMDQLASRKNYASTVKIKFRKRPSSGSSNTPSASEEEVTGVETARVGSSSARNVEIVKQINALFDEGMDHYTKGRPGSPQSNMHLAQAVKCFDQVIRLCEQALQNDPGNSALDSRAADASRYGYHARKMQTLGL